MNEAESDGVAERQRVAETLDRLRSGVRQRQAELTTVDGESEEQRLRLADLQAAEFLQEPICVSPRPVIGRLLVFVRKAFFHLFMKWYLRPVVMQVNRFNGSAGTLIRDLVEANRALAEQNRKLDRRIEALEAAIERREG
jgi:hypothetical protein